MHRRSFSCFGVDLRLDVLGQGVQLEGRFLTDQDGWVAVRDNGRGIEDFAKLLDLAGSGWEEPLESSEDPAGVGLFCLAPREVTLRSNGQIARIIRLSAK